MPAGEFRARWLGAIGAALIGLAPAIASPVGAGPLSARTDAARLLDWVASSGDAHGLPFIIIDKREALARAYDARGVLQGESTVLLGAAKGDDSPPGIGTMRLADIRPAMRITPAGRFEAQIGRDLGPREVLWVDYDAAVSLHRVVTGNVAEHRLRRLASPAVADKRISYGCINVPVAFFEQVVLPLFKPANGIVYVLPEARPLALPFT